jgi:hypothetical protein
MLCDRLPKVGKRSQLAAKCPLNGEQALRWVTVESREARELPGCVQVNTT